MSKQQSIKQSLMMIPRDIALNYLIGLNRWPPEDLEAMTEERLSQLVQLINFERDHA